MKHLHYIIIVLIISLSCISVSAKQMHITFLNVGGKGDVFFDKMANFMQEAANDLDIELEVIYCDRNIFKLIKEGKKLAKRQVKPDYVLLINESNAATKILPELDKKGIKTFLFNEGFFNENKEKFGKPGGKYKHWLAEILPDDYQAGYILADELIKEASRNKKPTSTDKLYIVGLGGVYQTNSSIQRIQGLKDAASKYPNVIVKQVATAYHNRQQAQTVTKGLLRRYPKASVIWAASDNMALGAKEAISQLTLPKDKMIYIGGIDWADNAIKQVKEGNLNVTVGGHFMDGGWALIMLYDYHHKIPFPKKQMKSSFSALTQSNMHDFLTKFKQSDWHKIDFRKFSKKLNPELKSYPFNLKSLIEQLQ